METIDPFDKTSDVLLDVDNNTNFHIPYSAQLNRGVLSGHPMGDHKRLLPTSLILILIGSILLPIFHVNNTEELQDSSIELLSSRSINLVDVVDWRVGDEWIYDSEFDVAGLLASGGITGASVDILTGQLQMEVTDIDLETIDNVSTLVYERESSGQFTGGASIPYEGFNIAGDLEVDFELNEIIRASDLGTISLEMTLDVDMENIGGLAGLIYPRIDLATLTILTAYSPPKEIYDFPLGVGEVWDTETTTTTTWSGEVFQDLFPIPDDTQEQATERFEVVSVGNPSVAYSGCSSAYNVTSYNASSGEISGYRWWCPNGNNDAWWHQTIDLGADIDFRLRQYNPVSRVHVIDVDLSFPAWPLDASLGVWLNASTANGQPVANQPIEFRYEIEEDIRTVTTAANGSAYVMFDTGHELDASPTNFEYASHGVIAWIPSTEEIGVSTITLDENLVEVDLAALSNAVSVSRTRGDDTMILNSLTGYNAIPGDELLFSVPVQNKGILTAPATTLEIQAPDGSTSQVNVPSLSALGVFAVDVSWTVPTTQAIGNVAIQFMVDPSQTVTADLNRSNNQGSFSMFVGRLPSAEIANIIPKMTFDNVVIDASESEDEDGGSITCIFEVELSNGSTQTYPTNTCMIETEWHNDGEYVVDLTVLDDEGDVSRNSILVVINNRAPSVNLAVSETSVEVGEAVTFNAQDSSDIDTMTPEAPIDMLWMPPDAPNGQPYTCSQGLITQACTVVPEVEGIFTMSFRAVDDDFEVTTETLSITVTNIAPYNGSMSLRDVQTGEILPPNNMQVWHVDEDQELELLGFVDDSPNDMPTLRYEWQPDLDVDPTWFETTDGPESVVPVSWDTNGPHVIAMQAFDDDGESSGTVSGWVWVHNVAPIIEISEDPLPLREDQRTLFTAEYSDTSSDMDTLVACWDLDPFINLDQDGSSDDDCDVTGPTINHRWSEAGNYQTIFHVTDDDGERASQVVEFTVRNQAPNAEIWVSKVGPSAGENVGLSGNLSTDDATDKPNLVYRWDLDTSVDSDGDTDPMNDIDEVGMEIWVVFDEPGERGIRLMVSDESETSTKDYTIVVMEEEGGFFGFIGGGGLVSTVVIILGLVLAGLLGVLALTSIRGRDDGGDSWDQLPSMEMATEPELPMAAPASNMFEAPAAAPVQTVAPGAPPVPVEGLPPGWTMEQWNHYGAQWLEQQTSQQPQPTTVQETASLPNIANDTLPINPAEDDLDLDF